MKSITSHDDPLQVKIKSRSKASSKPKPFSMTIRKGPQNCRSIIGFIKKEEEKKKEKNIGCVVCFLPHPKDPKIIGKEKSNTISFRSIVFKLTNCKQKCKSCLFLKSISSSRLII